MDAETRLVTDASDFAMGAAMEQLIDGVWKPLAFSSRKFTKSQLNSSAYDRELTAIYESIKYFKYFLEGHKFKVLTDHKPLTFALSQKAEKASPRQRRQLSFISQYTLTIQHLPGVENVAADALSRVDVIRLPMEIELHELVKEQLNDSELTELLKSSKHSQIHNHNKVYCDLTGKILRPYIPKSLRRQVFEKFHSSSHPGVKVTDQIIRQRYVWPNMHRDIKNWCNGCLDCQQSKISRHVKNEPMQFVAPDDRFRHVHMDIVGPLKTCEGYSYLLTFIDRFSRWTEAVPLADITADTVLRVFQDNWVARFGAPRFVSTDQGSQFESRIFNAYLAFIGCRRKRTVAYHPAANGMIERWHRSLKAALMCHNSPNWVKQLSTVLLGLRTAVRSDTGASPAEFLNGTTLRIPGEFFIPDDFAADPQIFIEDYREHMRELRPVPVAHRHKPRNFFFKDLHSCSHVFLRDVAVRKPLERPYSGPFKIIERISDHDFKIDHNGSPRVVSTELLKPAHFVPDDLEVPLLDRSSPLIRSPTVNRPILKAYPGKKKVRFNDQEPLATV